MNTYKRIGLVSVLLLMTLLCGCGCGRITNFKVSVKPVQDTVTDTVSSAADIVTTPPHPEDGFVAPSDEESEEVSTSDNTEVSSEEPSPNFTLSIQDVTGGSMLQEISLPYTLTVYSQIEDAIANPICIKRKSDELARLFFTFTVDSEDIRFGGVSNSINMTAPENFYHTSSLKQVQTIGSFSLILNEQSKACEKVAYELVCTDINQGSLYFYFALQVENEAN